jgi:hypothetical protein
MIEEKPKARLTMKEIQGGDKVEDTFRFHNRRASIRLKMIYPALYTRYDSQGRAYDQKMSRSMDVSLGGVKLESSYPVDSGEVLDISMALRENLINFKGKVVYVTGSEDQGFELGISIEDIADQDKIALTRFIYYFKESGQGEDT